MYHINRLYFFFLIIIITQINTSYITIPFKIQDFTWNDSEELIMKYIYKDILLKFIVGSPPQKVDLSAALGEFTTFIISKNSEGYEGATFNSNLSQTYKALSNSSEYFYFQTFNEAIKSKDNFIIDNNNNIKINELVFNLVTDISHRNFYCSYCEELTQPGMVGFLLAQMKNFEENVHDTNFITQLKDKNIISNYNFFFDFDKNNFNEGNIIIGKKPEEYYEQSIFMEKKFCLMKTSTINGDLDWGIKFDQIHYGKKKLNHIKAMRLRIEFGLISGYYEWEYMLENEFFSKYYEKKICFKKNTNELGNYLHYFYCEKSVDLSQFQPFVFTINEFNYDFILTKDDLFLDIGDKYVFLMIFGGISELVLGFPFIKKYQMVFNPNTKTIGFYIDIKNENIYSYLKKYLVIIIILGIILIGLLIVTGIFFIKKKKNKKIATELLEDNFDNNNKNNTKDNKIIDDNETLN